MYSSQQWWSNPGGGDPETVIGQSLRFRGAQTLVSPTFGSANTFSDKWSISFWVKFAGDINTTRQIVATGTRTAGGNYTILDINDGVQGQIQTYGGGVTFTYNGRKFRDPGAWYHFVLTNDEVYINGEAQGAPAGYWSNFDGCDIFGFSNWGGSPNSRATMYLADAYLVQQTLLPETFGEYNADNVWVAREVSFAFGGEAYSAELWASSTNNPPQFDSTIAYDRNYGKQGFDGATNTYNHGGAGVPNDGTLIWRLGTPVDEVTGIRFYGSTFEPTWYINEVEQPVSVYNVDGLGPNHAQVYEGAPITVISLAIKCGNGGNSPGWAAIEFQINGGEYYTVVDPYLWSNDCFTAPDGAAGFNWNTTEKNFQAGGEPTFAFNGSTTNFVGSGTGNSLVFRPDTAFTDINTVEVFTDTFAGYTYAINEVEVGVAGDSPVQPGTNGWKKLDLPAGWDGTLTNFGIRCDGNTGAQAGFSEIRLNGQSLVDGINSSYGANGFHLDFSDPNDIGADRSGNGNDFTATGFSTTRVDGGLMLANDGTPSSQTQALGTIQLGSLPQVDNGNRGQIYDIDFGREVTSFTQRYRTTNMENRWMQLFTSNTGADGDWTKIDERQFGPAANTAYDFNVTFPTAARYLRITQTATEGATWQTGVWNMQFVDDVVNPDYDLMQDSPTQNFATLNSIDPTAGTLADASLKTSSGTSPTPLIINSRQRPRAPKQ